MAIEANGWQISEGTNSVGLCGGLPEGDYIEESKCLEAMETYANQERERAVMDFKDSVKSELKNIEQKVREDLICREMLNDGSRDFIQLIKEKAIPIYYFEIENLIEKLK